MNYHFAASQIHFLFHKSRVTLLHLSIISFLSQWSITQNSIYCIKHVLPINTQDPYQTVMHNSGKIAILASDLTSSEIGKGVNIPSKGQYLKAVY